MSTSMYAPTYPPPQAVRAEAAIVVNTATQVGKSANTVAARFIGTLVNQLTGNNRSQVSPLGGKKSRKQRKQRKSRKQRKIKY